MIAFCCAAPKHVFQLGQIPRLLEQAGHTVQVNLRGSAGLLPEDLIPKGGIVELKDLGGFREVRAPWVITKLVGHARSIMPLHRYLVHPVVTLTNLTGSYQPNHLQDMTHVLLAGPEQFTKLRESFAVRPGATLAAAGYPGFDRDLAKFQGNRTDSRTVIYAPTHRYAANADDANFWQVGEKLVDTLLARQYRVIFRPHPDSFHDSDAGLVAHIVDKNKQNPKFVLDRSPDPLPVYEEATSLITDVSGSAYSFSFLSGRASIFIQSDKDAAGGVPSHHVSQLGCRAESVDAVMAILERDALTSSEDARRRILQFRDSCIANVGRSSEVIASYLDQIVRADGGYA